MTLVGGPNPNPSSGQVKPKKSLDDKLTKHASVGSIEHHLREAFRDLGKVFDDLKLALQPKYVRLKTRMDELKKESNAIPGLLKKQNDLTNAKISLGNTKKTDKKKEEMINQLRYIDSKLEKHKILESEFKNKHPEIFFEYKLKEIQKELKQAVDYNDVDELCKIDAALNKIEAEINKLDNSEINDQLKMIRIDFTRACDNYDQRKNIDNNQIQALSLTDKIINIKKELQEVGYSNTKDCSKFKKLLDGWGENPMLITRGAMLLLKADQLGNDDKSFQSKEDKETFLKAKEKLTAVLELIKNPIELKQLKQDFDKTTAGKLEALSHDVQGIELNQDLEPSAKLLMIENKRKELEALTKDIDFNKSENFMIKEKADEIYLSLRLQHAEINLNLHDTKVLEFKLIRTDKEIVSDVLEHVKFKDKVIHHPETNEFIYALKQYEQNPLDVAVIGKLITALAKIKLLRDKLTLSSDARDLAVFRICQNAHQWDIPVRLENKIALKSYAHHESLRDLYKLKKEALDELQKSISIEERKPIEKRLNEITKAIDDVSIDDVSDVHSSGKRRKKTT